MKEIEESFQLFWITFPRRHGDPAKGPAKILFTKLVASGIDPQEIIDGAKKFAEAEAHNIGTRFIMQAQKWLRNERWKDFQCKAARSEPTKLTKVFVREGTAQWLEWQAYLRKTKGSTSPCVNFGWYFPTERPPMQEELL